MCDARACNEMFMRFILYNEEREMGRSTIDTPLCIALTFIRYLLYHNIHFQRIALGRLSRSNDYHNLLRLDWSVPANLEVN